MRRLRFLAAVGVLVTVVSATTAGAATPTAQSHRSTVLVHKLDLSSMAKIRHYLRSKGINPKTVVIQRGKRNYVGPHCPGKDWTCTTATRVLQAGSQNTADCTSNTCTGLMQSGSSNSFRCVEKTSVNGATQACGVEQTGNSNYALIDQVADISSNTDPSETATQTADVTQTAQSGTGPPKNELHVFQRLNESISTPGSQTQNGGQGVRYTQNADNPGNNYSDVNQYLNENASGAGDPQMQDTGAASTGDCSSTGPPESPNQCVNGVQKAGTNGKNESHLHQLIDEDAKSSIPAHQTQGNEDGGNAGDIHQEVNVPDGLAPIGSTGTGQSTDHADQARRQSVSGPSGSDQEQTDPTRCCGASQQGGTNNNEDINQFAGQKSDEDAFQNLSLIGQCDSEPGSCTAAQHAKNDSAHSNESASCGSNNTTPCPIVFTTTCTSGGEGGGACTTQTTTPDDLLGVGDGIFTASNALPGVPLPGFEVTMGLIDPLTTVPSGLP
jgi:hypothetical protein